MAELSKYEILLNELSTLEAQAAVFKSKYREMGARNRELEGQVSRLKKENLELTEKISRVEKEPAKNVKVETAGILNDLDPKEKERLKNKLQSLISRIEFHLSS